MRSLNYISAAERPASAGLFGFLLTTTTIMTDKATIDEDIIGVKIIGTPGSWVVKVYLDRLRLEQRVFTSYRDASDEAGALVKRIQYELRELQRYHNQHVEKQERRASPESIKHELKQTLYMERMAYERKAASRPPTFDEYQERADYEHSERVHLALAIDDGYAAAVEECAAIEKEFDRAEQEANRKLAAAARKQAEIDLDNSIRRCMEPPPPKPRPKKKRKKTVDEYYGLPKDPDAKSIKTAEEQAATPDPEPVEPKAITEVKVLPRAEGELPSELWLRHDAINEKKPAHDTASRKHVQHLGHSCPGFLHPDITSSH